MKRSSFCLHLIVLLVLLAAPVTATGEWLPGFTSLSVDDTVLCLRSWNEQLIVGGAFRDVCGTGIGGIAAWSGVDWLPLADGPEGTVRALCEYGGDLVAAGDFMIVGDDFASNIARWDGAAWHSLNVGIFGAVHALAVFEGDLVAAGEFTSTMDGPAARVARWDGARWSPLGDGFGDTVYALAVYDGDLYAGGQFLDATGGDMRGAARWDGAAWRPLSGPVNGIVHVLHEFEGELILGGRFATAGDAFSDNIVRWNGTEYLNVELGLEIPFGDEYVKALTSREGRLYIGGRFRDHNAGTSLMIACWDGDDWVEFNPGMDDGVEALAVHDGGLFAGGDFTQIESLPCSFLAVLEDLDAGAPVWNGFQRGLSDPPRDMIVQGGDLVACGMLAASGIQDHAVARWLGSRWQTLPDMRDGTDYEFKYSLCDVAGELVVGGMIDVYPGGFGTDERTFAVWRNQTWLLQNQNVGLVATRMMDYGGVLAAVLTTYDYVTVESHGPIVNSRVRVMDTGTIGMVGAEPIYAICDYDGDIVIGGGFLSFESCVRPYLARWTGTGWTGDPFAPLDGAVREVIYDKGLLVVGGDFLHGGGRDLRRVARWNGVEWLPYGDGLDGRVHCLARYDGKLVAGGDFDGHVAFWDGADWVVPDGGVDGRVTRMVEHDGRLYLSGEFTEAGGLTSQHFACWDGALTPALLSTFSLAETPEGIAIEWRLGDDGAGTEFALTAERGGASRTVPWRTLGDGAFYALDTAYRDGGDGAIRYALAAREAGGDWLILHAGTIRPGTASAGVAMRAPHPNPCNPRTTVELHLDRAQPLRLDIFDASGRRVRTLHAGPCAAGDHALAWDGRDDGGRDLASGVYLVRMATGTARETRRLVLLR